MRKMLKWSLLPMLAAVVLLGAWSTKSAQAQDAPAAKGKIEGVVMKDGQPVANAEVRLIRPMRHPQQQAANEGEQNPGAHRRPQPVARTTTDEQGKFAFEAVAVGRYMVGAGIRGEGIGRAPAVVTADQTTQVQIELKPRPAEGPERRGHGQKER